MSIAIHAGWVSHLLKAIFQRHHTELREAFRPFIPEDGVVFDVGAHAGQFSKLLAGMAPAGQVYAFEPSEYARSILAPALKVNGVKNVEVVPMGLSDEPSTAVLQTPIKKRGGMGFGIAHLGRDDGQRTVVSQTVTLTTVDEFVATRDLKRVDFIKADIEGWEAHMLRGAVRTLKRFRPTLFLEISEDSLKRADATPGEIWSSLSQLGYTAFKTTGGFRPVGGYEGFDDYLFTA